MAQEGLWRSHEQPVFQRQVVCLEGRNTKINILELETLWMTHTKFEEAIWGKTVSFQIDNTMAMAHLLKGGTHCNTLICLEEDHLKCHRNGVAVCPEYLRGMTNIWLDFLFRGKKAKEWSVGDPAIHGYSNARVTPVVDLFASS